jgi:protein ImuB
MYACLYRPPAPDAHDDQRGTRGTRSEVPVGEFSAGSASSALNVVIAVAQEFSPRYECHGDDLVTIDVSGLGRLLGPPQTIGEELRRESTARGVRAHVAVAGTQMAAHLLALSRPGLTVIAPGEEAAALASIPIGILAKCHDAGTQRSQSSQRKPARGKTAPSPQLPSASENSAIAAVSAFNRWGLKTLGELAALPPADLVSRMGRPALAWQAMARGEDLRPLVPMLEEERFESSLDLEWPIEGLEPLSFVLTRLLEPLSTRLERRDRGAAVLHVILRLVVPGESDEIHARRLELPTPLRDVRTLRTLALLDLESHPPAAAIDRVTVVIDPTPGRVLQHTLFTRAHPTPEQLSTLLARLGAVMGQDRIGAPATVDSYRPGAFAMTPFAIEHTDQRRTHGVRREIADHESATAVAPQDDQRGTRRDGPGEQAVVEGSAVSASSALNVVSALRRCRQPVPARVAVSEGRPVRVTTDRREFAGGVVLHCAGPWRTSGEWWANTEVSSEKLEVRSEKCEVRSEKSDVRSVLSTSHFTLHTSAWDRDEWDVALGDGAVYRIFQERVRGAWFIDSIVD